MARVKVIGESLTKDLYYWEGPGSSCYRVASCVSDAYCRTYIHRYDSTRARWEIRDAKPKGEFVLARQS